MLKCLRPLSSCKPALCNFDWLVLYQQQQQSQHAGAGQACLAEFARPRSLWRETSGLLFVCHILCITIFIIFLPVAEMLHSQKHQRERKCLMVLPMIMLTERVTKAKHSSYRSGPCNDTGQTQRWAHLTPGHFRPEGCKDSFINSLTSTSTSADLLAATNQDKISFFFFFLVKEWKMVKAYHPGETVVFKAGSRFSALWAKLCFGAMHVPAATSLDSHSPDLEPGLSSHPACSCRWFCVTFNDSSLG